MLSYTWRRVTIALVEMISSATPREELDGTAHRRRRLHRQAASVVLTAVLVAVVVALSCGICGVAAVLYRRRRCDRRAGQSLGCDDDIGDDIGGGGGGDGVGKTTVVVGQQHAAAAARERQPPAATCRRTDYEDTPNGRNADALRPLLQARRVCRPASSAAGTADAAVADAKHRCGGPDVVISTATTLARIGGGQCPIKSQRGPGANHFCRPPPSSSSSSSTPKKDVSSGNWQQKHQSRQMTFNATNSNHQWSLQRLEFQKPNTTISHPRATLSTTTTPTAPVVLTNNRKKPKIVQTITDEPLSVTSQVLLNALHRESSI